MPSYGLTPYGPGPNQSPYFNAGERYGTIYPHPGDFLRAPIGDIAANLDPDAYYQRLISGYAGGDDPFSRYVQAQQARFLSGLGQARLTNPDLGVQEYAKPLVTYEDFARRFRRLSPQARGEEWGRYGPRTRIQRWEGTY